ncbi:hypothetical protein COV93_07950 [Candidatus Woesearchaeota archaeon CG11_big_fil_rev_8_21_14_0_20_43_8]|nr:MAG: hypothetical protein COV93_07950 [Candidatus Woesearchaeota archaeon CG11_big_fil_rev_8_21_14_0_20_43_8]PIO05528.1 MAG: hypothetical protein COT47_04460 [Candidatus Woesearchaeota archaeon CG08_land_8_20_14_0_20_43_7]
MRKAQISLDFILVLAFIFIIFTVLLAMTGKQNHSFSESKARSYARAEADTMASIINSAYIGGSGTTASVVLPGTLKGNVAYQIEVLPAHRLVQITWGSDGDQKHYASTLCTSSVDGSLANLSDGSYQLTNHGGVIIIG